MNLLPCGNFWNAVIKSSTHSHSAEVDKTVKNQTNYTHHYVYSHFKEVHARLACRLTLINEYNLSIAKFQWLKSIWDLMFMSHHWFFPIIPNYWISGTNFYLKYNCTLLEWDLIKWHDQTGNPAFMGFLVLVNTQTSMTMTLSPALNSG